MADSEEVQFRLLQRVLGIAREAHLTGAAVAVYDYQTGFHFSCEADKWFHAASTIKLAILFGLFRAADEHRLSLSDQLHVRNRFLSVVDGSPYRLEISRDSNSEIHDRIGRTMSMMDLAEAMIVTSSNLATNLLVDYLEIPYIQQTLRSANIEGIDFVRGVEDHLAYERGLNNRVTARGLLSLFQALYEHRRHLSEGSQAKMLNILFGQRFNRMIPAALPPEAKVAHKTGEISTVCHDAGMVFLPGRKPYGLVILTEFDPNQIKRSEPLAAISGAVYESLVPKDETVKV
ncbi:MAG: serine hydrolase [Verrucomicrobiae bacterium]|nr:serine hydrolase [Verrucomicrobiae bacterium]